MSKQPGKHKLLFHFPMNMPRNLDTCSSWSRFGSSPFKCTFLHSALALHQLSEICPSAGQVHMRPCSTVSQTTLSLQKQTNAVRNQTFKLRIGRAPRASPVQHLTFALSSSFCACFSKFSRSVRFSALPYCVTNSSITSSCGLCVKRKECRQLERETYQGR